MKYLEQTLPSPAENLALDEALLELAERQVSESLRIWESPLPFVVLGLSNRPGREVDLPACKRRAVPVLRRFSGGGTVVQGPGCLSYALALRIPDSGPLTTITGTNRFIMEIQRAALETVLGLPVSVQGHTDLALEGRKFSGNAQRRGRQALLFHGTILYAADLDLLGAVLAQPSREPAWRRGRTHRDFITNIHADRERIIRGLRTAWGAEELMATEELAPAIRRHTDRHLDPGWINRVS